MRLPPTRRNGKLRDNRRLIRPAFDEMLRLESPVQRFSVRRRAPPNSAASRCRGTEDPAVSRRRQPRSAPIRAPGPLRRHPQGAGPRRVRRRRSVRRSDAGAVGDRDDPRRADQALRDMSHAGSGHAQRGRGQQRRRSPSFSNQPPWRGRHPHHRPSRAPGHHQSPTITGLAAPDPFAAIKTKHHFGNGEQFWESFSMFRRWTWWRRLCHHSGARMKIISTRSSSRGRGYPTCRGNRTYGDPRSKCSLPQQDMHAIGYRGGTAQMTTSNILHHHKSTANTTQIGS